MSMLIEKVRDAHRGLNLSVSESSRQRIMNRIGTNMDRDTSISIHNEKVLNASGSYVSSSRSSNTISSTCSRRPSYSRTSTRQRWSRQHQRLCKLHGRFNSSGLLLLDLRLGSDKHRTTARYSSRSSGASTRYGSRIPSESPYHLAVANSRTGKRIDSISDFVSGYRSPYRLVYGSLELASGTFFLSDHCVSDGNGSTGGIGRILTDEQLLGQSDLHVGANGSGRVYTHRKFGSVQHFRQDGRIHSSLAESECEHSRDGHQFDSDYCNDSSSISSSAWTSRAHNYSDRCALGEHNDLRSDVSLVFSGGVTPTRTTI